MFRKRFRKKNRQKSQDTKVGGIGFLLAIPSIFILGLYGLVIVISLFNLHGFNTFVWARFGSGVIVTVIFTSVIKMPHFRTFIHEIKHGAVVLLTGNSVRNIRVKKHTGQIDYAMRYDKLHFGPIIGLAPYFFPLLSLPVFIVALFYQDSYLTYLLITLGATLAFDTATGIYEIHPHQTDIKRTFGGFPIAGSFIAGCHLTWINACLIWAIGGREGYLLAWSTLLKFTEEVL